VFVVDTNVLVYAANKDAHTAVLCASTVSAASSRGIPIFIASRFSNRLIPSPDLILRAPCTSDGVGHEVSGAGGFLRYALSVVYRLTRLVRRHAMHQTASAT
jgi:hypothetical protein